MITYHNIGKQKGFTCTIGWFNITFIMVTNKFRFVFEILKGE